MKRLDLLVLSVLLLQAFWHVGLSQAPTSTPHAYRVEALNRYVAFANESTHLLWSLRPKLEAINLEAIEFLNGSRETLTFNAQDVHHDFHLVGDVNSVCLKLQPSDRFVPLKSWYEMTPKESDFIPPKELAFINQQRDELMFILISILSVSDSLEAYSATGKYRQDVDLDQLYGYLNQMSLLYEDFHATYQRLGFGLNQVSQSFEPGLEDLNHLVESCKNLILVTRSGQAGELPEAIEMVEGSIIRSQTNRNQQLAKIEKLGLYYDRGTTIYQKLLRYAQMIIAQSQATIEATDGYPEHYINFNQRLFGLFSHVKFGMAGYYNQFIEFANQPIRLKLEITPSFFVLPKPTPEPELFTVSPQPVGAVEEIPANLSARKPSANRHLVLLVDVSYSMRKPEKLELLKKELPWILDRLGQNDRVSVVTYSGSARSVVENFPADRPEMIVSSIQRIKSSGSTQANKGLRDAFQIAKQYFLTEGNNRIIWISDGGFPIERSMTRIINKRSNPELPLSIMLLGKNPAPRTEASLRNLAQTGHGQFHVIQKQNIRTILLSEMTR
ncbi:VWA domain-containing protein [Pontibacter sp. G13]|uniref:vWA domain-containing protein n=1 Tax=Pontibacter sp. G13 TaxID=3074898 RepID=UPI0028893C07|nr:VWA domain-containing protein [Pontibacter sp. G13]WNJ21414.1 VWA domain-containing protein [Pontibacter sp. G13]